MRSIPKIGRVSGHIKAPPSAVCTLSSIVLASMSEGPTTIHGALDMDGSRYLLEALARIGFEISGSFREGLCIGDRTSISAADIEIDVSSAEAVVPYLIALLTFTPGRFILKGQNQHGQWSQSLVEPLRRLGAEIDYRGDEGMLPLQIRGKIMRGGQEIVVDETTSSPFLSALTMGVARMRGGVDLLLRSPIPRDAGFTLSLLKEFGGDVISDRGAMRISGSALSRQNYVVEGDVGAAAYWLAAAASAGGIFSVEGIPNQTDQPGAAIFEILSSLGVVIERSDDTARLSSTAPIPGGVVDVSFHSDLLPLVAAIAPSFSGPLTLRGLDAVRRRDPDLIAAMQSGLVKVASEFELSDDRITIGPGWSESPVSIDPHGDPRLAICFAIAGLLRGNVTIENDRLANQVYPRFWKTLDELVRSSAEAAREEPV